MILKLLLKFKVYLQLKVGWVKVMMSSDASVKSTGNIDESKNTAVHSLQQNDLNDPQSTSNLSKGWKYWKKRQGSAENHCNRKMSSVDPLEVPVSNGDTTALSSPLIRPSQIQDENPTIKDSVNDDDNNKQIKQQTSDQEQEHQQSQEWSRWLNPLSYIPQEVFNFPVSKLPGSIQQQQQQQHYSDNHSEHSSTLTLATPSDAGWFGWIWNSKKPNEENLTHDMLSSIELKKNVKEAKKAIHSPDSVWAWYQNHYNDRKDGEISVLDTKTETNPVELTKYPGHFQQSSRNKSNGDLVPDFMDCFRVITNKTRIRIATELYYNYPTEKHLYIKKNVHKPLIRYILIVSVVGISKGNKSTSVNSKTLSSLAVDSVMQWYADRETSFDYQIETISLEAAKLNENSSEDLFKLLINWREHFKKIDHVFCVGYNNSFPLAAKILEILVSRNLFDEAKKFGLLSIDGFIPGPYIDEVEASNVNYCPDFNQTLSLLIEHYNVKLSIIGTLNNIPGSLAIHLKHPNIFRTLYIPTSNYNNEFEVHLFQLLLIAHNLGHSTTRLLIQLNKYFTSSSSSSSSVSENLTTALYDNATKNSLSTTSLIQQKKITLDLVNDTILDNEYNLIWTLHAFIEDFKRIKNINSHQRVREFIESYKNWEPQSRSLKELKYMLEVLRIDDYCGGLLR